MVVFWIHTRSATRSHEVVNTHKAFCIQGICVIFYSEDFDLFKLGVCNCQEWAGFQDVLADKPIQIFI